MVSNSAIYVNGRRVTTPGSLQEIRESCRQTGKTVWVELYEPTGEEIDSVAGEFGLHHLVGEAVLKTHQRPRMERYGDTLWVVLKAVRYQDDEESIKFGEVRAVLGADFIVTVGRGDGADLEGVRGKLEVDSGMLRRGPGAILCEVADHVVTGYGPVVEGLENDIDEIEEDVFSGNTDVSRRTYELSREVIQFQRATRPLPDVFTDLIQDERYAADPEMSRRLRHVREYALRTTEQAETFRELLHSILNVNLTLVGISQSDQTKKISAWAAILFFPTLVAGIYGMNFQYMPELKWYLGYPYSLALMVFSSFIAYLVFKRIGWL